MSKSKLREDLDVALRGIAHEVEAHEAILLSLQQ